MSVDTCDSCGEQKDTDFDEGAYSEDNSYLCKSCYEGVDNE